MQYIDEIGLGNLQYSALPVADDIVGIYGFTSKQIVVAYYIGTCQHLRHFHTQVTTRQIHLHFPRNNKFDVSTHVAQCHNFLPIAIFKKMERCFFYQFRQFVAAHSLKQRQIHQYFIHTIHIIILEPLYSIRKNTIFFTIFVINITHANGSPEILSELCFNIAYFYITFVCVINTQDIEMKIIEKHEGE